jgi:hypothetical protein
MAGADSTHFSVQDVAAQDVHAGIVEQDADWAPSSEDNFKVCVGCTMPRHTLALPALMNALLEGYGVGLDEHRRCHCLPLLQVVIRVRPPLPRELKGTPLRGYQCATHVDATRILTLSENLAALGLVRAGLRLTFVYSTVHGAHCTHCIHPGLQYRRMAASKAHEAPRLTLTSCRMCGCFTVHNHHHR